MTPTELAMMEKKIDQARSIMRSIKDLDDMARSLKGKYFAQMTVTTLDSPENYDSEHKEVFEPHEYAINEFKDDLIKVLEKHKERLEKYLEVL